MSSWNTPLPEDIEKSYPYRQAWGPTIVTILVGAVLSVVAILVWGAHPAPWQWFLMICSIFAFLLGVSAAALRLQGKLRVILTRDAVFVPRIWNHTSFVRIPYAAITGIEQMEFQGNHIVELRVGIKKYALVHTWFSAEDFKDLIQTIDQRVPWPAAKIIVEL